MEHRILKALELVLQELRAVSDMAQFNSFDYCVSQIGQDILDQLKINLNPVYWDSKECAEARELYEQGGRTI